jgi:hypothetical protein
MSVLVAVGRRLGVVVVVAVLIKCAEFWWSRS